MLMKPVTNFWTTNRRLAQGVHDGTANREAHQAMAKWVADNPPFPGRAFREWITWMYKQNQLVRGRMRVRGERVDLGRIEQNLLVVTAGADHITPRSNTVPLLDLVRSEDVTHLDRPGGHIGLMAGSHARKEIWPDLADWLARASDHLDEGQLRRDRRASSGRARDAQRPIERFDPVGHTRRPEPRARSAPRRRRRRSRSSRCRRGANAHTDAALACAYFATFVSASAATNRRPARPVAGGALEGRT